MILGWAMSVNEPDAYQLWHSSQAANKGSNMISYKSARVDEILENYRREFDPEKLAALTEPELDDLVQDERIIRSRRKLDGTVFNAKRMLELEAKHGDFHSYLGSHGGFEGTLKDIRKQFKFMGDSGAYHFLWVVGEEVPPYEEWCAAHPRKGK